MDAAQQGFQMSTARLLGKCSTAGAAKYDQNTWEMVFSKLLHLHQGLKKTQLNRLNRV
jgi:hypothetical protein